jgi:hypothetical protein
MKQIQEINDLKALQKEDIIESVNEKGLDSDSGSAMKKKILPANN